MNKSPYEILGVAKNADNAAIKKAYHKLVMQYHPDKNPGNKAAEEKFKEINNAFDILKDPQKRAAYDQFGNAAFGGGPSPFGAEAGAHGFNGNPFGNGGYEFNFGGGDFSDIIDKMFRNMAGGGEDMFGGRGRRAQPAAFRGRDLLHEVRISLRDAFHGKTETVKFATNVKCEKCAGFGTADGKTAPVCERCHGTGYVRRGGGFFATESPCPECHGTGRIIKKPCPQCDGAGIQHKQKTLEVKIPAGVADGARLRLGGAGEAAPLGGQSGDLYIDIHIAPDPVFVREGDNLAMQAKVPFAMLALGGEINVQTIDDKTVSVKIPAGTQIGERLRMRGLGMPAVGRGATVRGDMFIDIATEVPKKLSEKQKKALEEFAGTERPQKKRWI